MKKVIIGLVVLGLIGAVVVVVGNSMAGSAAQQAALKTTPTLPAVKAENKVVAQAQVVPVNSTTLSFSIGGIIAEVPVKEGQHVDQGQLLVRLDSKQQAAAVTEAEANVKRAMAHVEELKAGPRPEEIQAAQAAVAVAQAALLKLQEPVDKNQVIAAKADMDNAYAALKQAQAGYDRVGGASNPYAGMLPTTLQLEQATNNYTAAQARYEALQDGPQAADIAAAQAGVDQAKAQLEVAKLGTRPETIATAEADVATANAALEQAKAVLSSFELRAPFAGTLAALNAKLGEQVSAGATMVQIADLSSWQIETSDLTEVNIVRVKEGSHVAVTLDAIPGLELGGTVNRIKYIGNNRQGDIVYTVVVQPDKMDERLRWNMTAQVNIDAK